MKQIALILAALLPLPAHGTPLVCSFTTLCSPQTDCQSHPGVPFRFEVEGESYRIATPSGLIPGTPLPHIDAPSIAVLFETGPRGFVILTLSQTAQAVLSQHDITPSGGVRAVSYFGTCAPET